MNELCQIIKNMVIPNFINMETAIRTYDRNADCCGAPAWRFAYHALHSADKWFFNPFEYNEPAFHQDGLDNPDHICSVVLSDDQLLEYLMQIREKTCDYLDTLTDDMLYEKPDNCPYSRLELGLRQFRHLSFHTEYIFHCAETKSLQYWKRKTVQYARVISNIVSSQDADTQVQQDKVKLQKNKECL